MILPRVRLQLFLWIVESVLLGTYLEYFRETKKNIQEQAWQSPKVYFGEVWQAPPSLVLSAKSSPAASLNCCAYIVFQFDGSD